MKFLLKRINYIIWLFVLQGLIQTPEIFAQPTPVTTKIEIVYFHAPNRCPSCLATESETKKILETNFRSEIEKGQVSFESLDLKDDKNKALVEKYEIVFPALLILKKKGNKEVKTDYSTTAFQYAYPEPMKYEKLLQAEILKRLHSK